MSPPGHWDRGDWTTMCFMEWRMWPRFWGRWIQLHHYQERIDSIFQHSSSHEPSGHRLHFVCFLCLCICWMYLCIKIRRLASVSHRLFLLILVGNRTHQQIVEKAHQVLDRSWVRSVTWNLLTWKTRRRRSSRFRCTAWPCHSGTRPGPEWVVVLSEWRPCLRRWNSWNSISISFVGAKGIGQTCWSRIVSPSWTWRQRQGWKCGGVTIDSGLFGRTDFCCCTPIVEETRTDGERRSVHTSPADMTIIGFSFGYTIEGE